jgi:hypothetical protein
MKRLLVLLVLAACHATPASPSSHASGAPATPAGARVVHVPHDVGTLATDVTAFAAFARELRTTLAGASAPDELFVLAMLDALDDHWPAAVATLDRIAATDRDARARAMRGLTIRVWADALAAQHAAGAAAVTPAAFRDALAARVDALPARDFTAQLAELRAMAQAFTPDVCAQLLRESVGPHVHDGSVPLADAHAIVFMRYAVVRLVPVGAEIDAVLAARGIALPAE